MSTSKPKSTPDWSTLIDQNKLAAEQLDRREATVDHALSLQKLQINAIKKVAEVNAVVKWVNYNALKQQGFTEQQALQLVK